MSNAFAICLGAAELAGGAWSDFWTPGPTGGDRIDLIMLGAIQRKIVVWHTGFWGSA